MVQTYRILVVGNGGVGKTTYLTRLQTGEFLTQYNASEVEIEHEALPDYPTGTALAFTERGGQYKYSNYKYNKRNYIGAIIMFDVTNVASYKSVNDYYENIRKDYPNLPIVICGNKVDLPNRKVKPAIIDIHHKLGTKYWDISAKACYNYEKPWMYLIDEFKKLQEAETEIINFD